MCALALKLAAVLAKCVRLLFFCPYWLIYLLGERCCPGCLGGARGVRGVVPGASGSHAVFGVACRVPRGVVLGTSWGFCLVRDAGTRQRLPGVVRGVLLGFCLRVL